MGLFFRKTQYVMRLRTLIYLLILPLSSLAQENFNKAESLFANKKFQEAQQIFESVIKQNPKNLKAIEYLGDIHGNFQQWNEALAYYSKLRALAPLEANYHYKYGGVLGMIAKESNKFKALGMISDIRNSFEKAISLNPKHIEARWALIELYLQLPGIVGGSESKANRYANELASISPVDGYLAKGKIAEYFNRYKTAEKQYLMAAAIGNSKMCYQKLSDLYTKMKQPEKSKQILLKYNEKFKS